MIKQDLQKIIKQLKANPAKYTKTQNYYNGDHELAFASAKFKNTFGELFREFALNLCPAVVDALRDKLKVINFNVEEGDKKISQEAWKLWQSNRMGKRSGEVHKEAVKNGDAYAIVWVDQESRVTIYPQKANSCTVVYDEETPGKILLAGKYWNTPDKKKRLNLYYPDRTEKYITTGEAIELPDADAFKFYIDEGSEVILNDYGIVPVFHFANNSDIGSFGVSELTSAMPIQNALNKSVLDMLVAMEFVSYPQRYAAGIEIEYDEVGNPIPPYKVGVDRLVYTENENAKFGSFEMGDLNQFLAVKADFRVDIACVTGTPLYYFMLTNGDIPSGEALKKSETRFIHKVGDRQESFGDTWEDVLCFALQLEGAGKDIRLFTDWEDPAPLSEKEKLDNIVVKKEIGISEEQGLREAKYGETDIEKMAAEKQAKADSFANSFNAGEITDGK